MQICVTLNPCLDKSLVVPAWQPGDHQVRGRECGWVVGGKGVNVARALTHLGQPARPALFLGGEIGLLCDRLLREQDGFEPLVSWTEAPTREILTVRTDQTAEQTAFFDPNPRINASEQQGLVDQLRAAFEGGAEWCVLSGSSPCRATNHLYATFILMARQAGMRACLDTYGECLLPALEARPDVVKMNRKECEQAYGRPLDSFAAVSDALAWIRAHGVAYAAITFGSQGVVAAWEDGVMAWEPPRIEEVNPIGAGDALTAGLIDALVRGEGPEEAFRWGMACAVCNVKRWGACDFHRHEVEQIVGQIKQCG
ncbi:MAG: 1-phosphofructokinase family hexose kinase [Planctomycetota bacterium]